MNKVGGRFILKKSNVSKKIPTISAYAEHTSGKWIDTDIYEGELYINTIDNRMWFRNTTQQMIEIPVLNTEDLKIDKKYLPNFIGNLNYSGVWDTSKEEYPILQSKGNYFIINKSGFINQIYYSIGDFIVFNGINWDKIDNTQKVFNSSNVIYDLNNKNLNEIIEELYNNSISDNIIVKHNGNEIFNLDDNCFTYKNNSVYHSGNSNNQYSDWISNNLKTNTLSSENIISNKIKAETISAKNINCESITNNGSISTNSLFIKDGKIKLSENNIYIQGNGKGLSITHLSNIIFEYVSFNKTFISHTKIKYNEPLVFDNELDIINKQYVDSEINKTLNIDINEKTDNVYRIKKNIKYINIDINIDNEVVLNLDDNENSQNIIICVENLNYNTFKLLFKTSNDDTIEVIKSGIISLYFNNKNKKWYKIS